MAVLKGSCSRTAADLDLQAPAPAATLALVSVVFSWRCICDPLRYLGRDLHHRSFSVTAQRCSSARRLDMYSGPVER
jgi:hypothetical protein